MTYQHLSMFERKAIYYRYNSAESIRSIGRLLGRCHTTISREMAQAALRFKLVHGLTQ